MIVEEERKTEQGQVLVIVVKCSTYEEAKGYRIPARYRKKYILVDGVHEPIRTDKRFPYYRVLQWNPPSEAT